MMPIVTPTPVLTDTNPFMIDLQQLGKWTLLFLAAGILLFLLLKIILDLRSLHYKD